MKKKILVTGAGGYIGRVLVEKLLKNNYAVRAVDRFFFGEYDAIAQNLELIQEDSRKLEPEHFQNVYAVIDLVAISNDPASEYFEKPTLEINANSRIATANLAKEAGVQRYILPSSASIYGFSEEISDENSKANPLTVYSKANELAEQGVLPLASDNFVVTVMRQATVYGYSPRMRFDLAINGMTYGCYIDKVLPLMRDGKQHRPMVHIQDTTNVMLKLLEFDAAKINGEIFNVGSEANNFRIDELAERIITIVEPFVSEKIKIDWYGDPDHRSYQLNFNKIESTLNWKAKYSLEDGVKEIVEALRDKRIEKTDNTLTLKWYKELVEWHKIIKNVEKYGGILDIE
ncbi:MAG: NAD(P)-dependent oxidoreductase [Calditrichaeota bacterium]|nr:MAG: NAD(P)-dependent oxidoreductase [Calditrichota bacterium]